MPMGDDLVKRLRTRSTNLVDADIWMMDAADRLCGGRLVLIHEGGYSDMYTPYCGLRIVETLSGLQSGVPDGTLTYGDNAVIHDHERAAVAAAAANVERVPTP